MGEMRCPKGLRCVEWVDGRVEADWEDSGPSAICGTYRPGGVGYETVLRWAREQVAEPWHSGYQSFGKPQGEYDPMLGLPAKQSTVTALGRARTVKPQRCAPGAHVMAFPVHTCARCGVTALELACTSEPPPTAPPPPPPPGFTKLPDDLVPFQLLGNGRVFAGGREMTLAQFFGWADLPPSPPHNPLAGAPGDFTLQFRHPPTAHADRAVASALRKRS